MKKLVIGLTLISSISAFASLNCDSLRMEEKGNQYTGVGSPKIIKLSEDGRAEDFLLTNYFHYKGEGNFSNITNDHAYWLSASESCIGSDCSLVGTIDYTSVMYERDFSKGSATEMGGFHYPVNIKKDEQQFFPLKDGNILRIKCH